MTLLKDGQEIERVFVLRRMPELAAATPLARIEQGYMADEQAGELPGGRIRRQIGSDGTILCTHTRKTGEGRIRHEAEREITLEAFQRAWPRTAGRRISKVRYFLDGLPGEEWVVDAFDDLPLIMAEVELASEHADITPPEPIRDLIVREVTDDPRYRNASLARNGLPAPADS